MQGLLVKYPKSRTQIAVKQLSKYDEYESTHKALPEMN
jgi:hypothetical protein